MRHNEKHRNLIEFVLIDFNSADGVSDWVISSFKEELATGYLKLYFTRELPFWHVSVAKNTAHLYAGGDVLVNLDSDNYTGPNGGMFITTQFDKYGKALLLHQFSGDYTDGSCGKIALHRDYFYAIGGYDESFEPVGHDDLDLLNRLHILGLKYKRISDRLYTQTIPNSQSEGIKNTNSRLSWEEMELQNSISSIRNINNWKLIANKKRMGIRQHMFKYVNGSMTAVNHEIFD